MSINSVDNRKKERRDGKEMSEGNKRRRVWGEGDRWVDDICGSYLPFVPQHVVFTKVSVNQITLLIQLLHQLYT